MLPHFFGQTAHIWQWGCQPYTPAALTPHISVRGWADPRAIVRLEGLGQLRNPMTLSGIKPVTFQLVAVSQSTILPQPNLCSQMKPCINKSMCILQERKENMSVSKACVPDDGGAFWIQGSKSKHSYQICMHFWLLFKSLMLNHAQI
jgi:hypothetical protein